LTLDHFVDPDSANKFCKFRNLKNESDVEQFFVFPLLQDLGFGPDYIETKVTVKEESIGKGAKRKSYAPDYICYLDKGHKKPTLIVDAKAPNEDARSGMSDALLYASVIRRALDSPKPEQYCLGVSGARLILKHYDSNATIGDLWFDDFEDDNPKYQGLKNKLSFDTLKEAFKTGTSDFEFKKPPTDEALKSLFEACHKLIWKTEKRGPSSAFYEFTKLMFIKMNEDRKLRDNPEIDKLIDAGQPLPRESVVFSVQWIEREEQTDANPVNTILFKNLRKQLETQITEKKKKRIFDKNEEIELEPATTKEVVRLLQHHDLIGVDKDLNGKLFETFLNATMRGKELGQYFTPRSVVLFMTQMANLNVGKKHIDRIIDACCGTGGFLIEAMAIMSKKVEDNSALTSAEKDELLNQINNESLWGIDAGTSPSVSRIARINMFLHRDGGSRIYFADALDKDLLIERGIDEELRRDRQELKDKLNVEKIRFSLALTNPPFAMKYEKKKPNEKRILERYDLAYETAETGKRELRTSLRSAVMFLERYYDLLEERGRLITVMDESILNTDSAEPFRDYIKKKFIIRAVISLPRNAFVKAESSVKTSVLYLRRKASPGESQPKVFMAISKNIGHNDAGRDMPDENDLPQILEAFRKFEQEAD
jgi:type I restriction enzyme M protein